MTNIFKFIKNILSLDLKTVLLIIVTGLLLFKMCVPEEKNNKEKIVKIDGKKYEEIRKKTDTTLVDRKISKISKGKDIPKYRTIYVNIPPVIDTLKIIRDYHAKHIYLDTINLGKDLGTITLTDTISENQIMTRILNANIKQKIIKETIMVKDIPKNQLYMGVNASFMLQSKFLNSVGTGVLFKNKRDNIYRFDVGLANSNNGTNLPLTTFIGGGAYWKIKLKK